MAIVAVSTNSFTGAGAAGGGAGTVAVQVAAAVGVNKIDTLAYVDGGAQVNATNAGGDPNASVFVDAGRTYHALTLGLGASFAGAVGVTPAAAVPVLDGTTSAHIYGGSTATQVRARDTVEVSAVASEDFVAIAAGVAGAGLAGVAGSAAAVVMDTTTEAEISGNTIVTAGGNVAVTATDDTVSYAIGGAVGIGLGGGGGAGVLAINLLTKTTDAVIDGATVDATGAVAVDALATRHLSVDALAAAVGLVGLGGGIAVETIGGALNGGYSAGSESGSSSSANALDGGNGQTVDGQAGGFLDNVVGAAQTSGSGGLPAIDPATSVTNDTIVFPAATGLQTGQAVSYAADGGQPIGGLTDGATYYVIVDGADGVKLTASYADAEAGQAIQLDPSVATGTAHRLVATPTAAANAARSMNAGALPTGAVASGLHTALPSGTAAAITNGSAVAAASVSVIARESLTQSVIAGGAGGGAFAGVGVGLVVDQVDADVSAYVGPRATITGLGGTGLDVEATRDAAISGLGIAGAVSGLVSLGSAVAVVSDGSDVFASVGDAPGTTGAAGAAAAVDGSSAAGVTVNAAGTETMMLATGAASIALGAGLGVAVTSASIGGNTTATIGTDARLGVQPTLDANGLVTAAGAPLGSVSVTASRTADIGAFDSGQPFGIGLAGGLLAGAAGVTAAATSSVQTRGLYVNSGVAYRPVFDADPSSSGAAIDVGSNSSSPALSDTRTIAWKGGITLLSAPNPTLLVDANGNILVQRGLTASRVGNQIVVADIENPGTPGVVSFTIPPSYYDTRNGNGVSTTSSITGAPAIEYLSTVKQALLINGSELTLVLNGLDTVSDAVNAVGVPVVSAGDSSGFNPMTGSVAGMPSVTVESVADVDLNGVIANGPGTTSISSSSGAILATGATETIATGTLALSAAGAIGGATAPLAIAATGAVTATAGASLSVAETGTLLASGISASGTVTLNATGSILHDTSSGADVDATGVDLTAQAGSLGTATALTGDIAIGVADLAAAGQSIAVMGAVQARAGAVTLSAGDNLSVASGGSVRASGAVSLSADAGSPDPDPDPGNGAIVDLEGRIGGSAVTVTTGADADTIVLRSVSAETTINAGAGANMIVVGSAATPSLASNAASALNTVGAALNVHGGGSTDLTLDDEADAATGMAEITSTSVAGLDLPTAGQVTFDGLAALTLRLGRAAEAVNLRSSAAGTATNLDFGSGTGNALTVGSMQNTVAGILGPVTVTAPTPYALTVNDGGNTGKQSGMLTASLLTLGGASVSVGAVGSVMINLGSGSNTFDIAGDGAATTVKAGADVNRFSLGTDYTAFVAGLSIMGGGNAGSTLSATFTSRTSLVLAATAGVGTLSGLGASQQLAASFSGVGGVSINQGASSDVMTIAGTIAPTTIRQTGNGATVMLTAASNMVMLDLDGAGDAATVADTGAAGAIVTATGTGDTLVIDRTGKPATVNGVIAATGPGAGTITNVLTGTLSFSGLSALTADLGAGNDSLSLDTGRLGATNLSVNGGGGDDTITLNSLPTGILNGTTTINGGGGGDTVYAVIAGVPTAGQFSNLTLTVETLIVDNDGNSTPIAWTSTDGDALTAAVNTDAQNPGAPVPVISTAGATKTIIIGGTSTGDRLDVVSSTATATGVAGTVGAGSVELDSGAQVLAGQAFSQLPFQGSGINFNDFSDTNGDTYRFTEGNFALSAPNALNAVTTGVSSTAATTSGTLTLTDTTGNPFSLYSVQLLSMDGSAHSVTFTAVTVNGSSVPYTVPVPASGISTILLPSSFTYLTSVSWTPGATVAVDNISAA